MVPRLRPDRVVARPLDHSSLTRIRERYGLRTFRRFFGRIVEEGFEAGLVWGEEPFYFDATTEVEANASLDSVRSRSLVEQHGLEGHLAGIIIFPEEEAPQPVEKKAQTRRRSPRRGTRRSGKVERPRRREREAAPLDRGGRTPPASGAGGASVGLLLRRRGAEALGASATDPDASPMLREKKEGASKL